MPLVYTQSCRFKQKKAQICMVQTNQHGGRMNNKVSFKTRISAALGIAALLATGTIASTPARAADVTLEFAQWWDPELPTGSFRALMDEFEASNPGIKVKLVSGPYSTTKEQIVAGAASKTMSDVVGLDGAWVNDFAKQGALESLSGLMTAAGYDQKQLASQIKVNGKTYMIPVVNFVYPLFTNSDLLKKAGVTKIPATRSEFATAAKKISKINSTTKGWVIPLSLEAPNGIQNDVMSLLWASGGSMLKNGKPNLQTTKIKDLNNYIKNLWDAKAITPGAFTLKEQDKVEEFTNGRVGMMIDTLSHVTLIKKNNPSLKFNISPLPAEDGYKGKRGIPYASWGIGVASNSKNKAEAWKLVSFMMSEKTNSKLSSIARAFPGNTKSVPDFVTSDAISKKAFEIYTQGYPANEFTGLPVAEELMRLYGEQFQKFLSGKITATKLATDAQAAWLKKF
jgi:multiple sugar transport system substrate-binding protein